MRKLRCRRSVPCVVQLLFVSEPYPCQRVQLLRNNNLIADRTFKF